MPTTKIRKRQIQLDGGDGLHSEYLRRTVDDSTDYSLAVAAGKAAGQPGLDLTGHRIVNVAEAVNDTDAPNWGQVRNLVATGDYRGEIVGYVVVRSGTTKYVQDADGDGVNEETTTPQITGGLYLYISAANGLPQNTVAKWTGSSWVSDNSQGTFDPGSTAADPGGSLAGALYLLTVAAQSGDLLPSHTQDTGEWTSDVYIKWNPSYDVSGQQNIGRWEIWGSATNIPFATKNSAGKVQIGDGIAVNSGIISADIDTTRALSYSGSTPNRKFGLNVLDPFKFTGGALDVKLTQPDPTTSNPTAGAGDTGGLGYYGKVGFYLDGSGNLRGQLFRHTLRFDYEYGQLNQNTAWHLQNIAIVAGGGLTLKTSGAVTVYSDGSVQFAQPLYLWYRGSRIQGGSVVVIQIPAGTTPALASGKLLVWRPTSVPNYDVGNSSTYPQSLGLSSGSWVVLDSGVGASTTAFENGTDIPVALRLGSQVFFLDGTVYEVPATGSKSYPGLGYTDWNLVQHKPTSFPPSAHTHPASEITFMRQDTVDFFHSTQTVEVALRTLIALSRRRYTGEQTVVRFGAPGGSLVIRRGTPNSSQPISQYVRGVLVVFRRSRLAGSAPVSSSDFLLGKSASSKVLDFGSGYIQAGGTVSGVTGAKLTTERGRTFTFGTDADFKADKFLHTVDGRTWNSALITWDSATWGASGELRIFPFGHDETAAVPPVDIARVVLLTDALAALDALYGTSGEVAPDLWVEEPVGAINNQGRNGAFSETSHDWQALDTGVSLSINAGALRIVEPSSGTPSQGLAWLPAAQTTFYRGKLYRIRFRAQLVSGSSTILLLRVQTTSGAVISTHSITLGSGWSTYDGYFEVPAGSNGGFGTEAIELRLLRGSGNYNGATYEIDDLDIWQVGVYADFTGTGIEEAYWWSSNPSIVAHIAYTPQPGQVLRPAARLTTFNLTRRTSSDHVVVFSQDDDAGVQHLQKLSLSDLRSLLGLNQQGKVWTGQSLTSGTLDLALSPYGRVTSTANELASVSVYINGVKLPADSAIGAYSLVKNASNQITAVRLSRSGIGYDIIPDDVIEVIYFA